MNRNFVPLSIGAALFVSLFCADVGHAVQINRAQQHAHARMAEMNKTANASVAPLPIPCGDGMRRTGPPCKRPSLPGSGEAAIDGTLYASTAITATLIITLVVLILLVSLSRRISHPPLVKSTQ
jgi:hypothetical protein